MPIPKVICYTFSIDSRGTAQGIRQIEIEDRSTSGYALARARNLS
jgi:hypothetical protein